MEMDQQIEKTKLIENEYQLEMQNMKFEYEGKIN